jgi:hypothetical protein
MISSLWRYNSQRQLTSVPMPQAGGREGERREERGSPESGVHKHTIDMRVCGGIVSNDFLDVVICSRARAVAACRVAW